MCRQTKAVVKAKGSNDVFDELLAVSIQCFVHMGSAENKPCILYKGGVDGGICWLNGQNDSRAQLILLCFVLFLH